MNNRAWVGMALLCQVVTIVESSAVQEKVVHNDDAKEMNTVAVSAPIATSSITPATHDPVQPPVKSDEQQAGVSIVPNSNSEEIKLDEADLFSNKDAIVDLDAVQQEIVPEVVNSDFSTNDSGEKIVEPSSYATSDVIPIEPAKDSVAIAEPVSSIEEQDDSETHIAIAQEGHRGNWYLKKATTKNAYAIYVKIKTMLQEIIASEESFLQDRDAAVEMIDSIQEHFSIQQDLLMIRLQDRIDVLKEQLRRYRQQQKGIKKAAVAAEAAVEVFDENRTQENLLLMQQLLSGLHASVLIRQSYQDMVMAVQKAIMQATDEETAAFEAHDKMIRVLSDDLVREYASRIESSFLNVQRLAGYVQQTMIEYQQELRAKSITIVDEIKASIQDLKAIDAELFLPEVDESKQKEEELIDSSSDLVPAIQPHSWIQMVMEYMQTGVEWIWTKIKNIFFFWKTEN